MLLFLLLSCAAEGTQDLSEASWYGYCETPSEAIRVNFELDADSNGAYFSTFFLSAVQANSGSDDFYGNFRSATLSDDALALSDALGIWESDDSGFNEISVDYSFDLTLTPGYPSYTAEGSCTWLGESGSAALATDPVDSNL